MTVRVGFDTTYGLLSGTGVGRYVRCLRQALEQRSEPELVPLAATQRPSKIRLSRIVQGIEREGIWYPWRLERTARRAGCSVLHVTQPGLVRSPGLPLVITVHDLLPLRHPELFSAFPKLQARVGARSLRLADRVLTNSEYTRGTVVEMLGISADKVVTTPLGVAGNFRPVQRNGDWLRDRFGIEGRFVLCVGTLEPRKNLVMALRAFERVAMREADCELLVVGPAGWRNAAFERLLERTGASVHLTGFVSDDDLVALYSATDCFVYPSLAEGFGLPVAEALACGAPVVTSDRTSLPEVAGDAALLADPEDEEAVTDAILRILANPRLVTELRERALKRAATFTWETCAQLTADVYAELGDASRGAVASTRS